LGVTKKKQKDFWYVAPKDAAATDSTPNVQKVFPDYALTSASFNSLYGIGVVRVAAQVKRGIMAARS
jgi:hypothetical protein